MKLKKVVAELDSNLVDLLDNEAKNTCRTRKGLVEFIIMSYLKNPTESKPPTSPVNSSQPKSTFLTLDNLDDIPSI